MWIIKSLYCDGNGVNIQLFRVACNSVLVGQSKGPHSRTKCGINLCLVLSQ